MEVGQVRTRKGVWRRRLGLNFLALGGQEMSRFGADAVSQYNVCGGEGRMAKEIGELDGELAG